MSVIQTGLQAAPERTGLRTAPTAEQTEADWASGSHLDDERGREDAASCDATIERSRGRGSYEY